MKWSQKALQWLKEIHDYIAQDNPTAAQNTVAKIAERVEVLAQFPEIGQRYQGRTDRDIRILLYHHYRIAYLVTPERDVRLLGIFHGSLDIDRFL